MSDAPAPADVEAIADWREQIGQRLMLVMTCAHGIAEFGSGAVCATCFANIQRIGRLIERELSAVTTERDAAVEARDEHFRVRNLMTKRADQLAGTVMRFRVAAELVAQEMRAIFGDETADAVEVSFRQHFDRALDVAEQTGPRCWRGECQTACYYPDACSERTDR